jgi:hypothetical protein
MTGLDLIRVLPTVRSSSLALVGICALVCERQGCVCERQTETQRDGWTERQRQRWRQRFKDAIIQKPRLMLWTICSIPQ